jgi:multidrug efflux pump subunit AcrA (membrane-fusion protein)
MSKVKKRGFFNFLRSNFLMLLATLGLLGAILFTIIFGADTTNPLNSLSTPPTSPYSNNISGIGLVEASSRNISIGSFSPGIVNNVLVTEGDMVKKGEALFILDQRVALIIHKKALSQLDITENNKRLEKVQLTELEEILKRAEGLKRGRAISVDELVRKQFDVKEALVELQTRENLIESAKINVEFAKLELEKTTVRSPIDALILKVRIGAGEFISGNEQDYNSPLLIGNIDPLYIRVQIDENDLWRFDQSMPAHAYLRSHKEVSTPISFVRIEPFAGKKGNLRGGASELIDTRILDIIYKIDSKIETLYIGQQLDVFIESTDSP